MNMPAALVANAPSWPPSAIPNGSLSVLAIEDDHDYFSLLAKYLDGASPRLDLSRSTSLRDARELADTTPFDAVLLDLKLPDCSGIESVLAARKVFPRTPIIVLSPKVDLGLGMDAIRNGAADCIEKSSLLASGLARRVAFACERWANEEALSRRVQTLQSVIAALGHDLKTPPRQISLICAMIEASLDDHENRKVQTEVGAIRDRCAHLKSVLEGVTKYAASASSMPEKSRHLVSETLARVLDDLDPQDRARVRQTTDAPVDADPTLLFFMLRNVIANGLTYWRNAPSQVAVEAREAQGMCDITIRDTGMGIAPHLQTRVFEPNTRCVSGREFPGTGFGLSIVRLLVEAHGGSVSLRSEAGRGTEVTLCLPSNAPQPA